MLFHKKNKNSKITVKFIAAILLAACVLTSLVSCGEDEVDMLSDDLSEYITLLESDYKDYPVTSVLDEYTEDHLTRRINQLIVNNREKHPNNQKEEGFRGIAIALGDTVKIRYRGYTVDENGVETDIPNASNFMESDTPNSDGTIPGEYRIGQGKLVSGFEEGLIGKVPNQYGTFFRIGSGKVEENQVLYVSYYSSSESLNKRVSYERIDLSREDIDKVYGDGFRALLLSSEIGVSLETRDTFKRGEESVQYFDMKIEFATDFEDNPITVDVVFPKNYPDATLRGVEAKFDVYVDYVINYQTKPFDETFILKTLGVKESSLSSYEGEGILEKYKNFLREELREEIKVSNSKLIIESMWSHYKSKVKVHALPESMVNGYYNNHYNNLCSVYEKYQDYYSLDEFAILYLNTEYGLGIADNSDWRAALSNFCKASVLEKLIAFYVIRAEGLFPNDEEYDKVFSDIILSYAGDEVSTLEGDAYDMFLEDSKKNYIEALGEQAVKEEIYFNFGLQKLVSYAKIG